MRTGEMSVDEIRAAIDAADPNEYPEWRRLSTLLLLHGLDDAVPQEWVDAGRDLLGDGNREYEPQLRRVLASPELMGTVGARSTNVWKAIDERISQSERVEVWGAVSHAIAHGRRSVLKWCAWRGGPLRTEAPRKVRERRTKIAKMAAGLRDAVRADKALPMDRLSATVYEARRLGIPPDRHEILEALDSLIADLERIAGNTDEHDPLQPQIGRGSEAERRQSLLERRLCSTFEQVTDGPCADLVAALVAATLDADADADAIGARWRAFRAG